METFRALGKNELPTSALFFHEPATKNEAIKTCEEHNETLFDIGVLSHIDGQLLYQQSLDLLGEDGSLWISSPTGVCSTKAFPSTPTCNEHIEDTVPLPFLCTNSSPDISQHPEHLTFRFNQLPSTESDVPAVAPSSQYLNGANLDYAAIVVYLVCGVIGCFGIARGIGMLRARRRFSEFLVRLGCYRRCMAVTRYLSSKQQRVSGVHFPVLGVCLLGFGFFAFTMIWTWVSPPYFKTQWKITVSPLAMRAGLLALGLYPFIFVFATKWNIVTFIAGYSHEKLQVYHRVLSYTFVVLSFIHTVPWIIQAVHELRPHFDAMTTYQWSWHFLFKDYFWSGIAFLFALIWLCLASLPMIRRHYYEAFKYIHILSAITVTAFFFVHCSAAIGSWRYLWTTVGIYGGGAGCRFVWMLYTNRAGIPRASFELLHSGAVKLRVKCERRERWRPGQHYFLHFLTVMPFQSHPFTIANVSSENNELVVLIRQAHGITYRLGKYLSSKETSITIPVLLDGPYGGPHHDLSIYEHVLLFAGGSGITFIFPLLQDLVEKSRQGSCVCMSIQVVWSVQNEGSVSWMIDELQKAVEGMPTSIVNVQIHVTGAVGTLNPESKLDKPKGYFGGPLYSRADVAGMIRTAALENRTMGVAACGPETLLYDVRNAVADVQKGIALGKPGYPAEVFLHAEHYSW